MDVKIDENQNVYDLTAVKITDNVYIDIFQILQPYYYTISNRF